MFRGLESECVPEWLDGLAGLYQDVLAVVDPTARLDLTDRLDVGGDRTTWRITPRGEPRGF